MRPTAPIGGALAVVVTAGLAATGCEREEEPAICPPIGVGDLVVSEISQLQQQENAWIELYNAGAGALDLYGLEVRIQDAEGNVQIVRVRRSLTVAPADRVVLWGKEEDDLPAYADYAWAPDIVDDDGNARTLFAAATVELRSCDLRIDATTYSALPTDGTWSLGVEPPTALDNDAETAWCRVAPGMTTPDGTPGEANPPCS